jgi:hypothetical protein
MQRLLFPILEEELGPLTQKHQQIVATLECIRLEDFIKAPGRWAVGRPLEDRCAVARAFVAKAICDLPTTRALLDRLESDIRLRRLCGWEKRSDVPSESTFSRAFAEFSAQNLPAVVHAALIDATHSERLVGHISRDSTEIEAREKPAQKPRGSDPKPKRKRGRPKKGNERPKEPTRLERQVNMNLGEMLEDLPTACDVGTKRNSKGHQERWIGYKLHVDVADGCIPVSCILTSASTHDSQVAIPLATMTNQRTTNLYDLMDSAYDAPLIRQHSEALGHVPIIDINPRRNQTLKEELKAERRRAQRLGIEYPEAVRYRERSTAERFNARLKDEFGGRHVRVRGHAKVACHLMFGVLAVTVDQLFRLIA